jgi:hypothetical protein
MKNNKNNQKESFVMLDGLMTIGELENGLRTADFACCEDVRVEPMTAKCRVQVMRDGNVYMTELPKRVRNKAIFREDNCSLSLGRDGRYYFVFSLDEGLARELPERLIRQASAIAQKVVRGILFKH